MRTGAHHHANGVWEVAHPTQPERARSGDHAILAVLMDIREELRAISGRLDCMDFLQIPSVLREIRINTRKRKYVRKAKAAT